MASLIKKLADDEIESENRKPIDTPKQPEIPREAFKEVKAPTKQNENIPKRPNVIPNKQKEPPKERKDLPIQQKEPPKQIEAATKQRIDVDIDKPPKNRNDEGARKQEDAIKPPAVDLTKDRNRHNADGSQVLKNDVQIFTNQEQSANNRKQVLANSVSINNNQNQQ